MTLVSRWCPSNNNNYMQPISKLLSMPPKDRPTNPKFFKQTSTSEVKTNLSFLNLLVQNFPLRYKLFLRSPHPRRGGGGCRLNGDNRSGSGHALRCGIQRYFPVVGPDRGSPTGPEPAGPGRNQEVVPMTIWLFVAWATGT